MIKVELIDKTVLKIGSRAGQIMATFRLAEDEKDMQMEALKEKYLGKFVFEGDQVYEVLGVSSVHFFLPDQSPTLGVLLRQPFKLVGEFNIPK